MYQMTQCLNCGNQHHVDALQLARQVSRRACPMCEGITSFAENQIHQPNVSPEAQQMWAAIAGGALFVGLLIFADRVSQWA